jgi:Lon protease-like protein
MMGDLALSSGEFGMVLASEDGIVSIGCTAVIERILKRYPDGRMDLIVVGRRRFQIESLNEDKPYLQAEVEIFEDSADELVSDDLRDRAIAATAKLRAVETPEVVVEPVAESPTISFQLAQFIKDVDKRQTMLAMRSEAERLRFLISVLPQYTVERERVAYAKRVAPLNGHAKHVRQES